MRRCLVTVGTLLLLGPGCTSSDEDRDAGDGAPEAGCGDTGAACDRSSECPEDQVCLSAACVCAFPRNYAITILSAGISERAPDGGCWDGTEPSCEPPDPYVEIRVGQVEESTDVVEDSYEPVWGHTFQVYLERDTTYSVTLWDRDEGEPQPILEHPVGQEVTFTSDNVQQSGLTVCSPDPSHPCCVEMVMATW